MIKNERKQISKKEYQKIIDECRKEPDIFLLQIDGKKSKNKIEYSNVLKQNLQVSQEPFSNLNAYIDIMTDLFTYYDKKEIVILIYNYDDFLAKDKKLKSELEEIFDTNILPFFEEEIEKCVVGGKKTKYNVFYTK